MKWVDVAGSPGVGKSTLCDPIFGPHEIPIEDKLPPVDWLPFLDEITRLFLLIRNHWSIVPAIRMNRRSVRKMATVARMPDVTIYNNGTYDRPTIHGPYIQTGLVQRGLGFGWRLAQMEIDLNELRPYFELMPVSAGVAMLYADTETVTDRNRKRLENPETRHENRDFMVPLMEKPKEIAIDVIRERGVPFVEIDTRRPIDDARADLIAFANENAHFAPPHGLGGEVAVLQAPVWW